MTSSSSPTNPAIGRPTAGRVLTVVFLGPDGSGKSTVVERLSQELARGGWNSRICHLRPHWGRSFRGTAVTDPHGALPRNSLRSVAQLVWWLVDYRMSRLRMWVPDVRPRTVVLFDRYIYDVLVDRKRYRYGGPLWLARLAARLSPEPDLVIVLEAPPPVLRSRKEEVELAELERQVVAYAQLAGRVRSGYVVDANRPVDEVVAGVKNLILAHGGHRERMSE